MSKRNKLEQIKMYHPLILLCILPVALLLVYVQSLDRRIERTKRQRKFADRAQLSDSDIFNTYMKDTGIQEGEFTATWHKVADLLHIDPGLLTPTDKLQEIAGSQSKLKRGNNDLDDLAYEIESSWRPSKRQLPETIETLGEAVIALLPRS